MNTDAERREIKALTQRLDREDQLDARQRELDDNVPFVDLDVREASVGLPRRSPFRNTVTGEFGVVAYQDLIWIVEDRRITVTFINDRFYQMSNEGL